MVGVPTRLLVPWLDGVFAQYLIDGKGDPVVKVHGFGMTSVPLMRRYPWWSVDSSTWILTSSYGSILVPMADGTALTLPISDKIGSGHRGLHFRTLAREEQRLVERYLATLGITVEEAARNYMKRDVINMAFFMNLEETRTARPLGALEGF